MSKFIISFINNKFTYMVLYISFQLNYYLFHVILFLFIFHNCYSNSKQNLLYKKKSRFSFFLKIFLFFQNFTHYLS